MTDFFVVVGQEWNVIYKNAGTFRKIKIIGNGSIALILRDKNNLLLLADGILWYQNIQRKKKLPSNLLNIFLDRKIKK